MKIIGALLVLVLCLQIVLFSKMNSLDLIVRSSVDATLQGVDAITSSFYVVKNDLKEMINELDNKLEEALKSKPPAKPVA